MKSIICTLFEDKYHLGVGALVNSLFHQGFRGDVVAGYRGELPIWALNGEPNENFLGQKATTYQIFDAIKIHFILLETYYHLTNYKPDFILKLSEHYLASNIFYFDPDIVVTQPWSLFEDWVTYGVALCEDLNSPLEKSHPKRMAWRKYFKSSNIMLEYKTESYVNGGFIGLQKQDISFILLWKNIQELMADSIGGLDASKLGNRSKALPIHARGAFAPFSSTDQDALNATIEAWNTGIVCILGRDAMGFKYGRTVMQHALGRKKPWNYHPLRSWLNGTIPRNVDKIYWQNVKHPIQLFNTLKIQSQNYKIKLVSFLGRFYSK